MHSLKGCVLCCATAIGGDSRTNEICSMIHNMRKSTETPSDFAESWETLKGLVQAYKNNHSTEGQRPNAKSHV